MIPCRRQSITSARLEASQAAHAGLWLDRYMAEQLRSGEAVNKDHETPTHRLAREVAQMREPDCYAAFFERWQAGLIACGARAGEARVQGRMVVGLGEESVLEISICLHHTYGVPYIPGSALKGLAAAYARQRLDPQMWGAGTEAYRALFGDTTEAGCVAFFDALYMPRSGLKGQALHIDVITVHHPDYYQRGSRAPADWDSPTPIPFLSATGKYLIALAGPQAWVDAAFEILERALAEMGIGAKTSSGYGRMKLNWSRPAIAGGQQSGSSAGLGATPADEVVGAFLRQLDALPSSQVAPQISQFVERWRLAEVDSQRKRRMAQAIVDKIRAVGREKAYIEKPWYGELLDFLKSQQTSQE